MHRGDHNDEQRFFLKVLNNQHEPLGGLVDVQITLEETGVKLDFKGLDASGEIEIEPPGTVHPGRYRIDVTAQD